MVDRGLSIHDGGVEKSEDRDCLKKCKPHLVRQGVRALKEGIRSIKEEFTKLGCMCSKVCIHHLKASQHTPPFAPLCSTFYENLIFKG